MHAIVLLREVAFAGNHPVEKDTTGTFASPEWVRGRLQQFPVAYTRAKSVKIMATFDVVFGPSAAEDVEVRATLKLGGTTLEWTGTVNCGVDQTELVTAELTSSGPLPNAVGCFDTADIEFFAAPASPLSSVGTSKNCLYVLLGDPSGTPPYWTLLDISCRAAAGTTTPAAVIGKSFVPFTSRALTRKRDGKGLTYWNPDTTTCTNTRQLLASGDGSGQCGSWWEPLVDMYKAHGIGGIDKVLIVRTISDWQTATAGFLVKNWQFVGPGTHPPPFTYEDGG